ncbi:hypothetical protein NE454_13470, partial [Blautia producta]|uniref:hypothetical protein n=1 Tax=Blautia producta TaxID=33035 RepID=UPI002109E233
MPIIKGKLLNQLTHVALRTQVYYRRWRTVNMYAGFCDMSAGNAEVPLSIDKDLSFRSFIHNCGFYQLYN